WWTWRPWRARWSASGRKLSTQLPGGRRKRPAAWNRCVKKWQKLMNYRRMLSWLSLGVLITLVGVLGLLQYRWIGEISQMEKKKLQDYMQSSLNEVSRDFSSELNSALRAL